MDPFDGNEFPGLSFDSEFETFLGIDGDKDLGLSTNLSSTGPTIDAPRLTLSTHNGHHSQGSPGGSGLQCPGCVKYKADLDRLDQEHRVNFQFLKKKVISTDMLIRRFKAKTDESEVQGKTIIDLKQRLEQVTRDSDILSEQLKSAMENLKPLREKNEHLKSELHLKADQVGKLKDRLHAEEAFRAQRNALDEHNRSLETDIITLKRQNNTLNSKNQTLESQCKELERNKKSLCSNNNITSKRLEVMAAALVDAQEVFNSYWSKFHRAGLVRGGKRPNFIPDGYKSVIKKLAQERAAKLGVLDGQKMGLGNTFVRNVKKKEFDDAIDGFISGERDEDEAIAFKDMDDDDMDLPFMNEDERLEKSLQTQEKTAEAKSEVEKISVSSKQEKSIQKSEQADNSKESKVSSECRSDKCEGKKKAGKEVKRHVDKQPERDIPPESSLLLSVSSSGDISDDDIDQEIKSSKTGEWREQNKGKSAEMTLDEIFAFTVICDPLSPLAVTPVPRRMRSPSVGEGDENCEKHEDMNEVTSHPAPVCLTSLSSDQPTTETIFTNTDNSVSNTHAKTTSNVSEAHEVEDESLSGQVKFYLSTDSEEDANTDNSVSNTHAKTTSNVSEAQEVEDESLSGQVKFYLSTDSEDDANTDNSVSNTHAKTTSNVSEAQEVEDESLSGQVKFYLSTDSEDDGRPHTPVSQTQTEPAQAITGSLEVNGIRGQSNSEEGDKTADVSFLSLDTEMSKVSDDEIFTSVTNLFGPALKNTATSQESENTTSASINISFTPSAPEFLFASMKSHTEQKMQVGQKVNKYQSGVKSVAGNFDEPRSPMGNRRRRKRRSTCIDSENQQEDRDDTDDKQIPVRSQRLRTRSQCKSFGFSTEMVGKDRTELEKVESMDNHVLDTGGSTRLRGQVDLCEGSSETDDAVLLETAETELHHSGEIAGSDCVLKVDKDVSLRQAGLQSRTGAPDVADHGVTSDPMEDVKEGTSEPGLELEMARRQTRSQSGVGEQQKLKSPNKLANVDKDQLAQVVQAGQTSRENERSVIGSKTVENMAQVEPSMQQEEQSSNHSVYEMKISNWTNQQSDKREKSDEQGFVYEKTKPDPLRDGQKATCIDDVMGDVSDLSSSSSEDESDHPNQTLQLAREGTTQETRITPPSSSPISGPKLKKPMNKMNIQTFMKKCHLSDSDLSENEVHTRDPKLKGLLQRRPNTQMRRGDKIINLNRRKKVGADDNSMADTGCDSKIENSSLKLSGRLENSLLPGMQTRQSFRQLSECSDASVTDSDPGAKAGTNNKLPQNCLRKTKAVSESNESAATSHQSFQKFGSPDKFVQSSGSSVVLPEVMGGKSLRRSCRLNSESSVASEESLAPRQIAQSVVHSSMTVRQKSISAMDSPQKGSKSEEEKHVWAQKRLGRRRGSQLLKDKNKRDKAKHVESQPSNVCSRLRESSWECRSDDTGVQFVERENSLTRDINLRKTQMEIAAHQLSLMLQKAKSVYTAGDRGGNVHHRRVSRTATSRSSKLGSTAKTGRSTGQDENAGRGGDDEDKNLTHKSWMGTRAIPGRPTVARHKGRFADVVACPMKVYDKSKGAEEVEDIDTSDLDTSSLSSDSDVEKPATVKLLSPVHSRSSTVDHRARTLRLYQVSDKPPNTDSNSDNVDIASPVKEKKTVVDDTGNSCTNRTGGQTGSSHTRGRSKANAAGSILETVLGSRSGKSQLQHVRESFVSPSVSEKTAHVSRDVIMVREEVEGGRDDSGIVVVGGEEKYEQNLIVGGRRGNVISCGDEASSSDRGNLTDSQGEEAVMKESTISENCDKLILDTVSSAENMWRKSSLSAVTGLCDSFVNSDESLLSPLDSIFDSSIGHINQDCVKDETVGNTEKDVDTTQDSNNLSSYREFVSGVKEINSDSSVIQTTISLESSGCSDNHTSRMHSSFKASINSAFTAVKSPRTFTESEDMSSESTSATSEIQSTISHPMPVPGTTVNLHSTSSADVPQASSLAGHSKVVTNGSTDSDVDIGSTLAVGNRTVKCNESQERNQHLSAQTVPLVTSTTHLAGTLTMSQVSTLTETGHTSCHTVGVSSGHGVGKNEELANAVVTNDHEISDRSHQARFPEARQAIPIQSMAVKVSATTGQKRAYTSEINNSQPLSSLGPAWTSQSSSVMSQHGTKIAVSNAVVKLHDAAENLFTSSRHISQGGTNASVCHSLFYPGGTKPPASHSQHLCGRTRLQHEHVGHSSQNNAGSVFSFGHLDKLSPAKPPVMRKRKLLFSEPEGESSAAGGDGDQSVYALATAGLTQVFGFFKVPRLLSPCPPSPSPCDKNGESPVDFASSTPSDVVKVEPLTRSEPGLRREGSSQPSSLSQQMAEARKCLARRKSNAPIKGTSRLCVRGRKRNGEELKAKDNSSVDKTQKLAKFAGSQGLARAVMCDLREFLADTDIQVNAIVEKLLTYVDEGQVEAVWQVLLPAVMQLILQKEDEEDIQSKLLAACQREGIPASSMFVSQKEIRLVHLVSALLALDKELDVSNLLGILWAAIFSKSTTSQPVLLSLCRLFTFLCMQQGDLEQARVLVYNIAWCGYLDLGPPFMAIVGVWPDVLDPTYSDRHGTIKLVLELMLRETQRDQEDQFQQVCHVMCRMCQWQVDKSGSRAEDLLKSLVKRTQHIARTSSSGAGTDATFEAKKAIELLLVHQGPAWTDDHFIRRTLVSVTARWDSKGDSKDGPPPAFVISMLEVFRSVLIVHPLSKSAVGSLLGMVFSRLPNRKISNMSVEVAFVEALLDMVACSPDRCLAILKKWQTRNSANVPPEIFSKLLQP